MLLYCNNLWLSWGVLLSSTIEELSIKIAVYISAVHKLNMMEAIVSLINMMKSLNKPLHKVALGNIKQETYGFIKILLL